MINKLRVAAYCRVSSDKDDQANSLESQQKYFNDYINGKDEWKLVKIYVDDGLTGTSTKKRVAFNEMIENALDGNIDLIITKEVSRFARNTLDSLKYTRQLKDNNVHVIFTLDGIDTRDSDSEFRLSIFSSIAQEESRKTSERVKWGQKRSMEKGVVFGRDLLGYRVTDGKLEIVEEEAEIVRLIFHKYLNEGKGTHVIARELREAGYKPLNPNNKAKYKNNWSNTVILRVLRNEKYVGDLLQQKTYTPNYLEQKKKYNRGEKEFILLENHHKAIIDRPIWEDTKRALKERGPSEDKKLKYSNRYWCSGKLKCGICESSYVSRTKKRNNGEIYKAWRCFRAANNGTKKLDNQGNEVGCDSHSVNEKVLIECIVYILNFIIDNKDELKKELIEEIKSIRGIKSSSKDREKIEAKIKGINNKKVKLIDLRLEGEIEEEDFKLSRDGYNEELELLKKQLDDIENIEVIQKKQIKEINKYIEEIDKILSFKDSSDSECIYREVLENIIIYNNQLLHIQLKCLPNIISLTYETCGKLDSYKVNITSLEVLE